MDPEQACPGMIVTLHVSERQMVILWVEPDGAPVRRRWLDGTEWKDDRFLIADLKPICGGFVPPSGV